MGIAITLEEYCADHHINYEVIRHRRTETSLDSSNAAHIPPENLSKAVILQDSNGDYLMAAVSSRRHVSLDRINKLTNGQYRLVSESKLAELFPDCEPGAIPSIGSAYQMKMLVDDELLQQEPVYLEAGDHRHLLKVNREQFAELVCLAPHGDIHGINIGFKRFREKPSLKWDN